MQVISINNWISPADQHPDSVRVEGGFFILDYGLVSTYYNNEGRPVFKLLAASPSRWSKFRAWWRSL